MLDLGPSGAINHHFERVLVTARASFGDFRVERYIGLSFDYVMSSDQGDTRHLLYMDSLISILAVLAGIIGIVGSILPALPGTPVSWVGLLILYIWGNGTNADADADAFFYRKLELIQKTQNFLVGKIQCLIRIAPL